MKFSANSIATREGNLILDSHKLSYHYERVAAWEAGERVAPVSVDMALSRACGAMCSFLRILSSPLQVNLFHHPNNV